jgi:hypothetical protein
MANKEELLELKKQRLGYHEHWLRSVLAKAKMEKRSDLEKEFKNLLYIVTSDQKMCVKRNCLLIELKI